MAKKAAAKNTKPKGKVKEEETVEEETVDTAEEETEEVDTDAPEADEEEVEEESAEEEESEDDSEEEAEEEEIESEVETADATGDVTVYGIYRGDTCLAIFTEENHGKDFIKIAKAKAKASNAEARPYVSPTEAAKEKTVVNIVNASNSPVRQFALSTHGKEYKQLAQDFLDKHGEKRGYRIAE